MMVIFFLIYLFIYIHRLSMAMAATDRSRGEMTTGWGNDNRLWSMAKTPATHRSW